MNNILINLHNSSYPTQPHLITADCHCFCGNTARDKFSGENMSRGNTYHHDATVICVPPAALKHGIRNPESGNGNGIMETETETEYGICERRF